MATFSTWNWTNRHVQSDINDGQFLASKSILVSFGPPYLGTPGEVSGVEGTDAESTPFAGGDLLFPCGMIGSFGMQQGQQLIPVPEIGSDLRYILTGPSSGNARMGKTLIHGPSFLRCTHAYFKSDSPGGVRIDPLISEDAANLRRNPLNQVSEPPGYDNLFLNLSSDLFKQAFGVMLFIQDSNREVYGGVYLESCFVGMHGMSVGAGQAAVGEEISFEFNRVRPVKFTNAVPLMSKHDPDGGGRYVVAGSERTIPGLQGDNRYIPARNSQNN